MFELKKFGINELSKARKFYQDWGLVVMTDLIPVEDIDKLKDAYRDVLRLVIPKNIDVESCQEGNGFDKGFIEMAQQNDDLRSRFYDKLKHHVAVYKVGLNPNILDVVQAFGQKQTILDALQVRIDPPNDQRFLWHVHQDVLGTKSRNFMSTSIYLSDVSEEMGPIEMSPGSHKVGYLGHHPDRGDPDPYKLAEVDPEIYEDKYPLRKFYMKTGETLFFHHAVIHKSGQNKSDRIKWNIYSRFEDASRMPYLKGDDTFKPWQNAEPYHPDWLK